MRKYRLLKNSNFHEEILALLLKTVNSQWVFNKIWKIFQKSEFLIKKIQKKMTKAMTSNLKFYIKTFLWITNNFTS